jgi:hypothetical protein
MIQLQQSMLKSKSEQLVQENQTLTLKENYLKLDQAKREAYDKQLDGALGDMSDIDAAWKASGGNIALMTTKVNAHLKEEVDSGKITPQQAAALQAKVLPKGSFDYGVFSQAYKQTQQAATARDVAKQELDAKAKEADIRRTNVETANAGKQVVSGYETVTNPDGTTTSKPTIQIVDRGTGKILDTGVGAVQKGPGGTNVPLSDRASQLQAALTELGVPIPTGVSGTGTAAKAQLFETLVKAHPDKSPMEIAQMVRSGKLDMTAAGKEVAVAATKAAATAGSVASIFGPKGEAETVLAAAEKAGLSDVKSKNWTQDQWSKVYNSPDWAAYKNAHKELVSSMAAVFSRGGASSVNAQNEAEEMFPVNSSIDEIKARLAVSRQVAAAVERGNTAVIDAIKGGKPLADVIAGADSNAPSATTSGASVSNW